MSTRLRRDAIKARVDEAKDEGFPSGVEEREAFFNEQVNTGEILSTDRTSWPCAPLSHFLQWPRGLLAAPSI